MADLVVGLAKSVVEGALTKAQSAIEEEALLQRSAQRDLVFITGEFEMMHSFLNVASKERVENKVVMTWVRQVRELAYDVEDCIEFVVHLDAGTSWWLRLVPSCMRAAQPLDEAVDDIEQLKARVESVSARNSRYSLIGDSGSKPAVMPQQHQQIAPGGDAVAATASGMLAEARDAARRGRQGGPGPDLTQLITKRDDGDHHLQVISVWGTGGDLGTTSTIRKAYRDPEICQSFACRAWVKLMHPFDPREFVQRFMAQVYANSSKEHGASVGVQVLAKMEATRGDDLLGKFVQEVNEKRYLVVLEGLSDMVDWDAIRTFLPDMDNGSWIIVSTQQFEIASLCIGHSCRPLELKQFSADHSVCAFFKEGSQGDGVKGKEPMVCEVSQGIPSNETILSIKKAAGDRMKNYPLVGRESQLTELCKYTVEACFDANSQVISVWGIAGVGKSALVRNLYYDRMLHSNQFNKYSWVDVSHPFNLRDFSRSLLLDFDSEKDPIKDCRELLKQQRCLIVIDDLQYKEEWDLIHTALVSKHSGSVIIVITTEASIATYCTNNEEMVFNVKGLEAAAAVDLFKKEVQRKNPSSPLINECTNAEVEELILKCGGLPKVIVAIAGLLAMHTVALMDTVRSLNHRFMHQLDTNPEYDSLRGLFSWMHSYFRTCPDLLKPCIFYLSIFPRDQIIRRRRLVRRWIAEGYSRDNDEKSAEDRGEKFFSKLLELSIIQQLTQLVTLAFSDMRVVLCQVNGFIREYIVSRRMEENLVFELGGNCALTTQRTGRHLIVLRSWNRDVIVFESIDFSRLRSLTVFGKWEPFFISKSMRLLRVLDLEDALGVNDDDVEKMVQLLRRLKFLSLRGCREIRHLPSSLGDLRQLQSLDVRHTSITNLPTNIAKLQKLQYVRAGTTLVVNPASTTPVSSSSWLPVIRGHHQQRVGVVVRRGLGKLTALHTLGVVNVGASGGKAIVEELKKLTQLRKLGVSGINMRNSKELFSAISGHVHLESLLVRLDKDSQDCLDDTSLPLENLRSVKLYGLRDKFPLSSIQLLSKLSKLDLEMDTLHPSDIELLAKLPKLCILRLCIKQLSLHFYTELCGYELPTYQKVKVLEIACSSSGSLHLIFGSKSMRNLELLKLDCSYSRVYKLTGLNHLSEIKQVLLKGTNDEIIRVALQDQLAKHPKKPAVKLEQLLACSS